MVVCDVTATTRGMVVGELATKSGQSGALSAETGKLEISSTTDDGNIFLVWAETGGPQVKEPAQMLGFGSRMISRSISHQLDGMIAYDWQPTGLVVTLRLSKDRLAR